MTASQMDRVFRSDRRDLPPFTFRDFGSLVSLGGYGAYGSLGKFGLFKGGFIQGRVAQLGHVLPSLPVSSSMAAIKSC